MGNRPSAPSPEQRAELEQRYPELCARAACAIQNADVLIVATGAGWSADSGLAVYRDVADVAAYHDRGLTYRDICQPHWLDEEPALFYGFWGGCYNDYRDAAPHEGYAIIKRWVERRFKYTEAAAALRQWQTTRQQQKQAQPGDATAAAPPPAHPAAGAFFSYTSNVDAHWLAAGFGEGEVHEIHGNAETWQCARGRCHGLSHPRDGDEEEALQSEEDEGSQAAEAAAARCYFDGRWCAPPSHRFQVDEVSRLSASGSPLVEASAAVGSGQPHDATAFTSNWPRCVACGGHARPAILMFGDHSYVEDDPSCNRWEEWRGALCCMAAERKWKVAILELGCGGNVTTVRMQTESTLEELCSAGVDAALIRVNPELPLADDTSLEGRVLPLLSGGLDAVRRINVAMGVSACASSSAAQGSASTAATAAAENSSTSAGVGLPNAKTFASAFEGYDIGGLTRLRDEPSEVEDDHVLRYTERTEDATMASTGRMAVETDEADVAAGPSSVRAAVRFDDEQAKARLEKTKALLRSVDATIRSGGESSDGAAAGGGDGGGTLSAWARFASSYSGPSQHASQAPPAPSPVLPTTTVTTEDVD